MAEPKSIGAAMDERDEEQMRRIAREVARETVMALLDEAGVTMEDLIYARRQREGAEQAVAWMKRSAITVTISGLAWAVWQGVRTSLGK